jgi:hypothetical protein
VETVKDQTFLTEEAVYELLSFLVSSAQLCVTEPQMYGTFRLVDGASRMLGLALESGESDDEFLPEFKKFIDDHKLSMMTDEEGYIEFLHESSRLMARQMKRRAKGKA